MQEIAVGKTGRIVILKGADYFPAPSRDIKEFINGADYSGLTIGVVAREKSTPFVRNVFEYYIDGEILRSWSGRCSAQFGPDGLMTITSHLPSLPGAPVTGHYVALGIEHLVVGAFELSPSNYGKFEEILTDYKYSV